MIEHRKPPLPDSFYNPLNGFCRWCGKPVEKPRRLWHPDCEKEYMAVIFSSQSGRIQLEDRDGYRCAHCGCESRSLEVDHIVPLATAPREIHYWTIANMQLLCHTCHVKKTTTDMIDLKITRSKTGGLF